jgi:hypothetical protein
MTALLAFLSLLTTTPDLTKEEVKRLVAAGISDDVIVEYVRKNGPVQPLTAQDLIDLRQANVSEKVLAAMLEPAPSQAQESGTAYTTTYDSYPWYYPSAYFSFGYYAGPYAYPYYYRYPYYGYPYYRYPYYSHPYYAYPYHYSYPYRYATPYPYSVHNYRNPSVPHPSHPAPSSPHPSSSYRGHR